MVNIDNYDVYVKRMEASLQEKVYFLKYLSPDVEYILDFGCADGTLLYSIKDMGYRCCGIDNEEMMQKLAREKLESNSLIYSSLDEYLVHNKEKVSKTAIVLSSVIHEIFSYSNISDALKLLNSIFRVGFKQICIRDMAFNEVLYYNPVNYMDLNKVSGHPLYKSYINYTGHEVEAEAELYHFLLKYKYVENWNRELCENYVMFSMEELLSIFKICMGGTKYQMNYYEHKLLEYTRDTVYKDFGLIMNKCTNYKVIYSL